MRIFFIVWMSTAVAAAAPAPWVAKSDENALLLLQATSRFDPEEASGLGLEGFDDRAIDLAPGWRQRRREAVVAAMSELERRRAAEKDPMVAQDLEIILDAARKRVRRLDPEEKYLVPYFPLERMAFGGLRVLLEEQLSPERRKLAVARLRRYAGMEPGSTPLSALAEARMREKMGAPGLLMPSRAEVEKNLSTAKTMLGGLKPLFVKFQLDGWQEPLAKLEAQCASYDAFLQKEVLPRAREDFRLPPELYAFRLEEVGVDLPPSQLATLAHAAFAKLQAEMQALAGRIAAERHLPQGDYREVLRALKKDQLVGDAILPHYQSRLADLEKIIVEHKLVTLPARHARIRLASAAESAQTPAPNMRMPRLIHNSGEQGEFVLPLSLPAPPGSKEAMQKLDDFTFSAASWTLTAHEARPGHELQFDQMVERGVSLARAVYARNSTNIEGWGLYAESIALPYMPLEGQLVSLDFRLHRAARAFLDPELQAGQVTREQAKKLLTDEVGLSDGMANSEVERYTFWAPGQATSYFYGYTKLVELRAEVERRLGARFDARELHDFILGQGLLPPPLLKRAVLARFAPQESVKKK
jgi:Bacterial protein of unknown function (DUF885)